MDLSECLQRLMANQEHCQTIWDDFHGGDEILTNLYKLPYDHLPIDSTEQILDLTLTSVKLLTHYSNQVARLPIADDISKTALWFELFGPCPDSSVGVSLLCVFHNSISNLPEIACQDEEFSFAVLHYLIVALLNADKQSN